MEPRCKCHDEPMLKTGFDRRPNRNPNLYGIQKWECAEKRRERQRIYDANRFTLCKEKGLCPKCRHQSVIGTGNARCWDCRRLESIRDLDKTIGKYEYLLSLPDDHPEIIAIVQQGKVNVY